MNILDESGDELEYVIQPSQWVNLPYFLMVPAMIWLFFEYPFVWGMFILMAIWRYLDVYFWRYEFREKTIVERKGVLSVIREEVHYYRIKSIRIEQPIILRIVGLSNIYIITSEAYKPQMLFYAIPNGEVIRNLVKNKTFQWKQQMNIKDVDVFNPQDL